MDRGRRVYGLDELPISELGSVLTIGNFDGVHLGHQRIVQVARERARQSGAHLLAVTFDPLPETVLAAAGPTELIVPTEVRYRLLLQCGTDFVVVAPTDRALLSLSPEDFVRRILLQKLHPVCVVEGPDFRFGHGRAGDLGRLRELGRKNDFEVADVEPVKLDLPGRGEVRISSSLIRELVRAGDMEGAGACLGRPYTLHGRVVGGEQRGRTLQYPTANIDAPGVVTPADGIYAGRAQLGGRDFAAAVSIGNKPTFGPKERTIEANLLDAEGQFYDLPIAVSFIRRLRDQIKFADAESLRRQIAKDVEDVRRICP